MEFTEDLHEGLNNALKNPYLSAHKTNAIKSREEADRHFHGSVWQVASLSLSHDRREVSLSSREAEKIQSPKSGSHMATLIQETMIKNNDHSEVKHRPSYGVHTLKRPNEAYLLAPLFYNHFPTFHWA